jgi:methionyl aminopeptidase
MGIVRAGVRLGDIGHTVQKHAEASGFSVVRTLVGHGIGKSVHEDPSVANFGTAGRGIRLEAGTTIAIEPMLNAGGYEVETLSDGWTVATKDRQPSAHYENTIVIHEDEVEILTL